MNEINVSNQFLSRINMWKQNEKEVFLRPLCYALKPLELSKTNNKMKMSATVGEMWVSFYIHFEFFSQQQQIFKLSKFMLNIV